MDFVYYFLRSSSVPDREIGTGMEPSDPQQMLLSRKKITENRIEMLLGWRHSRFNVFCGPRIRPNDEKAMDNLARYIVRASFSQERMTYIPEESKVLYQSKDGKEEKAFDALEWLAAMCSHVPNKGEQMVRYKEDPQTLGIMGP